MNLLLVKFDCGINDCMLHWHKELDMLGKANSLDRDLVKRLVCAMLRDLKN